MTVVFTGEDGADLGPASLRGAGSQARRELRWGVVFVSPWLVGFAVFYLIPLVASLVLSFTSYELVSDEPTRFTGLDNWRELTGDDRARHGLWVTLQYSALAIPAGIFVPLLFAWLLTAKRLWGRSLFRVLFYLPTMVPFVASVIVWRFYLNPQSGWLAKLLGTAGVDSPDFIRSGTWIMPALTLISLWGVGNAMIIFIAGLNGVPKELYEAAEIDGAGHWQRFRHVTWPMISPITFYNLVITLVGIGQYFAVPFALTSPSGGVNNIALFYTMHFYNETFVNFRLGYGSALAWAMFVVVFALTAVMFWSARYWVHYQFEER